ncbi:hypothetical protein MRB53_038409 [Persea americana]|nr:hypothetical protein MRB53_038409 [Persea americana]
MITVFALPETRQRAVCLLRLVQSWTFPSGGYTIPKERHKRARYCPRSKSMLQDCKFVLAAWSKGRVTIAEAVASTLSKACKLFCLDIILDDG